MMIDFALAADTRRRHEPAGCDLKGVPCWLPSYSIQPCRPYAGRRALASGVGVAARAAASAGITIIGGLDRQPAADSLYDARGVISSSTISGCGLGAVPGTTQGPILHLA